MIFLLQDHLTSPQASVPTCNSGFLNEFHFSGTQFDNKFPTCGVASCIMVAAPIFAWIGFAKFLVEIRITIPNELPG